MRRLLSFFVILFLSAICAFGQISQGGTPVSFSKQNRAILQKTIPTFTMPYVDVNRLVADDIVNDKDKSIPWRFGENINVNIDVKLNGLKDILPNGDKIWRLRIFSSGAMTMNFTFDKYVLPNNAKLYLYNEQNSRICGAFTGFNNQTDQYFATTLIEGEAIIIEYFEPSNVSFEGQLHLNRVTHGYRNVLDFALKAAKAYGTSGTCNNNVACPLGVGWENEIKSVCMLVVGGSGFCTGALVNNTLNDGTPYVLTANHCSSSNDFASWVFWYNWQSAGCTNTTNPAHDQVTTSGSILKARNAGSDFCLVQMNQTPPSSFNIYYAGWNYGTTAATSTMCIHHPDGDVKKISSAGAAASSTYSGAQTWNVNWTSGVTEPGSSGSPLFDQNHKIIGQLYGGASACGATPANMNDDYGKFSVSWNTGTTAATRLVDWLDPTNLNPTTIVGYDPNTPAVAIDAAPSTILEPLTSYCSVQIVSPKVVIRNVGSTNLTSLTVRYNIDAGVNVDFSWTGNLASNAIDTVVFPAINLTTGNHAIHAYTLSPNGGTDQNSLNDSISKAFSVALVDALPITEDFEAATFPSINWSIDNPDGATTWVRTTQPAGNGSSTASAYIDFMNYATLGQLDGIITPKINLSGSAVQMTFKVAYRRYDVVNSDSMKILVSTDCGVTYNSTPIYYKGGTSLATGADLTTAFFPTITSDWRLETIDLSPFAGNNVIIKFVAINRYGNNLFIDDINIMSLTTPPVADFAQSDTASCTGQIDFTDQSTNIPSSWLWNFGDGTTSNIQNPSHAYTQNGFYTVTLLATNQFGSDTLIKNNIIHINLPIAPGTVSASRCGTGTVILNATGTGNLEWYDADIAGNLVGTGPSFTTPSISASTTYYVEDHLTAPSQYFGNLQSNSNGANYNNTTNQGWLNFDAFVNFKLISVEVNAIGMGNRKISLINNAGITIDSAIINIPDGISRITLNFDVPAGSAYRLVGSASANLWRGIGGITYPYTLAGVASITSGGSSTTPVSTTRYYFFFNWEVQEYGCVSARSAVVAAINNGVVPGTAIASPATVCTGSTSTLTLTGSTGNIQWLQASSATGPWTNVAGGSGAATAQYITASVSAQTWYTALLSSPGCTNDSSNVVSVSVTASLAAGTASALQNTVCIGDVADLLLTGSTGNIQWQYSTNGTTGWTDITGATNAALTTPAMSSVVYFRANLSSGTCTGITSNVVMVTVNPALVVTITTTNATAGNSDGTATANVTGGTGVYTYTWQNGQTTQTAVNLAAGSYSVTASDGYCSTASIIQIAELSAPVALFNTTPVIICIGNVVNFIDNSTNNPTAWLWIFEGGTPSTSNQQNPSVTYNSEGSFAVTLIASNAYGSDTLFADNLITVANPVLTISVTNETIAGAMDGTASVVVTGGSAPYIYNWSNSSNTPSISSLSAGTYSVVVVDANGCIATAPAIVGVGAALNLIEVQLTYSLHPNPVTSSLIIEMNEKADMIEILDVLGRVVFTNTAINSKQNIDMMKYQNGIYLVKIYLGNHVITEKVILQK